MLAQHVSPAPSTVRPSDADVAAPPAIAQVLREWKVLAGALMEEGPLADGRSSADLINLAGVLAASAARTAAPPKAGKLVRCILSCTTPVARMWQAS
jgi:hypothetical protein